MNFFEKRCVKADEKQLKIIKALIEFSLISLYEIEYEMEHISYTIKAVKEHNRVPYSFNQYVVCQLDGTLYWCYYYECVPKDVDGDKSTIEEIHNSLINGQKKQMTRQIKEYGEEDFFNDYWIYLRTECYANGFEVAEYLKNCVIAYMRFKKDS